MLTSTILLVLSAVATLVDAQPRSHGASVNLRSVHRRHHAKLAHQAQVATTASQSVKRRRSRSRCPAQSSSTVAAAGAPTLAASLIASASSSDQAPQSSSIEVEVPSSSTSVTEDEPETTSASKPTATTLPATSVASSSQPEATNGAATNGGSSDASLERSLFPSGGSARWSTSYAVANPLPLSDATLRPHHVLSDLSHDYVDFAGKRAMKAHYPKGSFNFQHYPRGGLSMYFPGPSSVNLAKAKEAVFAYSVMFPKGFDFNMGGKLFGFYGGTDDDGSISCSGGARRDDCFSARFMFRTDGQGELYTYLPPSFPENKAVCNIPPYSDCNPTYGASVARGAFKFTPGVWATLAQRVRLNDNGKSNGEIEVIVDGKSLFTAKGLRLINSSAGSIWGVQAQTFFGGSTLAWASPKDQDSYFSDFSISITEYK